MGFIVVQTSMQSQWGTCSSFLIRNFIGEPSAVRVGRFSVVCSPSLQSPRRLRRLLGILRQFVVDSVPVGLGVDIEMKPGPRLDVPIQDPCAESQLVWHSRALAVDGRATAAAELAELSRCGFIGFK